MPEKLKYTEKAATSRLTSEAILYIYVHNITLYHSVWADQRLAPVLQIICNHAVYKWL